MTAIDELDYPKALAEALARAEAAEKALAELEATLVQEDTAEIQLLKARIEDTRKDSADAWNQRNAIYAELVKVQARAETAEKELTESEEKSDQRLKMALEWKRSRDDYYERLDIAKARAEAAENERDVLSYKLEQSQRSQDVIVKRAEAAEKECDRLREELTKIACMADMNHDGNHLQKIARTALEAKP